VEAEVRLNARDLDGAAVSRLVGGFAALVVAEGTLQRESGSPKPVRSESAASVAVVSSGVPASSFSEIGA